MQRHAEWERLSDEQLIDMFDQQAPTTYVGVGFIQEELFRREMKRQGDRIERMAGNTDRLTNQIRWLTWAIAGMTLVLLAVELAH
jgi:hypothetical protein